MVENKYGQKLSQEDRWKGTTEENINDIYRIIPDLKDRKKFNDYILRPLQGVWKDDLRGMACATSNLLKYFQTHGYEKLLTEIEKAKDKKAPKHERLANYFNCLAHCYDENGRQTVYSEEDRLTHMDGLPESTDIALGMLEDIVEDSNGHETESVKKGLRKGVPKTQADIKAELPQRAEEFQQERERILSQPDTD